MILSSQFRCSHYYKNRIFEKKHHALIKSPSIITKVVPIRRIMILYTPPKKRRRNITHSFSSDCLLYDMSYTDIFMWSVYKNFIMFQLPCIFMYRVMKFSTHQIVYFLLFNAFIKTLIDIYMIQ